MKIRDWRRNWLNRAGILMAAWGIVSGIAWGGMLAALSPVAAAESYSLEHPRDSVLGQLRKLSAAGDESLATLSRRLDLGYEEIVRANPRLDPWRVMEGAPVVLPTQFVLPRARRVGIVLNIPEMRLYLYRDNPSKPEIRTYAVGIGREGWSTPTGKARVTRKRKKPTWIPPHSIRQEMEEEGDPLPAVVPPGPDNPLGEYALNLSMPGYLLHGTNQPYGIGMRVSHGCIRLNPDSIAELYGLVRVGTPVRIVDQPVKVGRRGRLLYLEAHPPLREDPRDTQHFLAEIKARVEELAAGAAYRLEAPLITHELQRLSGVPLVVGVLLTGPPPEAPHRPAP